MEALKSSDFYLRLCILIFTRPCITSEIHHISSAFTGKNIWSRPYTKKVPIVFLNAFSCKNPFIKLCWSKATQRKVDPEKIKNDSILKIVGWPSLQALCIHIYSFPFKIPLHFFIHYIPGAANHLQVLCREKLLFSNGRTKSFLHFNLL